MDLNILLSSIVSFISFLCVLPMLFRVSAESKSTMYMFITALMGIVQSVSIWMYLGISQKLTVMHMWIGGIYVLAIYGLLVLLFLLAVFSVLEASLTLRFLLEIARVKKGITRRELVEQYGLEKIIQRRLERLVASSEILRSGNTFSLSGRKSYFRIRELLLSVFRYVFP